MIIYAKDEKPLQKSILRDVFDRGINKLIIVTGGTQKGKSRWVVRFCDDLDETFKYADMKTRIAIIDPEWFMEVLDTPGPRGTTKSYDDCGLGINAQDWYDFQVKTLSRLFHIIGNQGWIIFLTTPHLKFITSQVRAICTDRVVVKGRDTRRKQIKFKFYADIKYDEQSGKEYRSLPTIIYPNGKRRKIKMFRVKEPNPELLKKFYALESEKKMTYRQESMENIKKEKDLRAEAQKTRAEVIAEKTKIVLENPSKYIKEYNGRKYIDVGKIETELDVGGRVSKRIKQNVEEILGLNQRTTAPS